MVLYGGWGGGGLCGGMVLLKGGGGLCGGLVFLGGVFFYEKLTTIVIIKAKFRAPPQTLRYQIAVVYEQFQENP